MHFIVFPSETLCNAQSSPLIFPEQLQCASGPVKVVLGYRFQHLLRKLDVTVLVVVVVVSVSHNVTSVSIDAPLCGLMSDSPRRIVNGINELVQLVPLGIRQQAGLLVPPREIDVHAGHCVCRGCFDLLAGILYFC